MESKPKTLIFFLKALAAVHCSSETLLLGPVIGGFYNDVVGPFAFAFPSFIPLFSFPLVWVQIEGLSLSRDLVQALEVCFGEGWVSVPGGGGGRAWFWSKVRCPVLSDWKKLFASSVLDLPSEFVPSHQVWLSAFLSAGGKIFSLISDLR